MHGDYTGQINSDQCQTCDAGYEQPNNVQSGTSMTDACTACISGRYATSISTANCAYCEEGKYMEDQYTTQTTDTNCVDCLAPNFTSTAGSFGGVGIESSGCFCNYGYYDVRICV